MARLLCDMPNLLWRSLSAGRDAEAIKATDPDTGKETWINTAGYGVENALQLFASALNRYQMAPKDMVFALEGKNAKLFRQSKIENKFEYKGARGTRPARAYVEYNAALAELQEHFMKLGASFCVQERTEADDILAYLAAHAEEPVIVLSHDGDLTRLVGTNPKGFAVSVGNNDWLNVNPYGPFPNDLITLYKSLVGDSSDSIPGAKGFGDKSFLELMGKYGVPWLYELEKLVRDKRVFELNPYTSECKLIARIVNNESLISASYACARLYPEVVDTDKPLQWFYGMVRDKSPTDDKRYEQWYATRTLIHGRNLKKAIAWAKKQVKDYIALDLETTTPEQSDDWLAARSGKEDDERSGVDVYGSEIVSCGLTFGDNNQHSFYLTHRHAEEQGVFQLTEEQLRDTIQEMTKGKKVIAHNAGGFELPVLRNHFEFEGDQHGFLPDVHCTKLLVSYADENFPSGLKQSAKRYLGYDQQTYQEVTQGRKMDELPATEVLHYGSDDTVVTAALYNHLSFLCQTENTWKAYCEIEQLPMYLQAHAFLKGVPISLQRMRELEIEDDATYDKAWATLRSFLIAKGWEGTSPPTYTQAISAASIKEAYQIVTGEELKTQVRTPAKLVAILQDQHPTFAEMLRRCLAGEPEQFTKYVRASFRGEPLINLNSPKQVANLLYQTMELPIRERNELTEAMILKGLTEGNPSTDELAIQMALHFDKGGQHPEVLKALLDMKRVETRRKMYYRPYPCLVHWKDGGSHLLHPQINQCATVTRRHTSSSPNVQQLPKRGEGIKFREIILPHKRNAVVVSMDFVSQEIAHLAVASRDPNLLSCFVGENKRDLHSMTGAAISGRLADRQYTYDELVKLVMEGHPEAKKIRAMGKMCNFAAAYGAMAKKIALTLMVSEEDAQAFLDARAEVFSVSEEWKQEIIERTRVLGYVTSPLGTRRHLRAALAGDFKLAGRAERQAVNFIIQGGSGLQTRLAMKAMWESGLFFKYDSSFYFPVHDECVSSVALKDLKPFLKAKHACMTQPFAGFDIPIESSISFGWSLGQQIEIGSVPSDEAIDKGLHELLGEGYSSALAA